MIANIIAFVVTVIALVILEIATEGQTSSWIRIGVAMFFFGVANAINRGMRHGARSEAVSAPILEEQHESVDVVETGGTTENLRPTTKTEVAAHKKQNKECKLAIGRIVDDRLMLTAKELERITLDPSHPVDCTVSGQVNIPCVKQHQDACWIP